MIYVGYQLNLCNLRNQHLLNFNTLNFRHPGSQKVVYGKMNYVNLEVTVRNKGENSYQSHLRVIFPSDLVISDALVNQVRILRKSHISRINIAINQMRLKNEYVFGPLNSMNVCAREENIFHCKFFNSRRHRFIIERQGMYKNRTYYSIVIVSSVNQSENSPKILL